MDGSGATQSYWTDDLTGFLEDVKGGRLSVDDLSGFDDLVESNVERARTMAEVIAKRGSDDLKVWLAGSEHIGAFPEAVDILIEDGLSAPLSRIPDETVPIEALLSNEALPEGAALTAALKFVGLSEDDDVDLEGEYGMLFKAFAGNEGLSDRVFQNLTRIDTYDHGNAFVADALHKNASYQEYSASVRGERGGAEFDF